MRECSDVVYRVDAPCCCLKDSLSTKGGHLKKRTHRKGGRILEGEARRVVAEGPFPKVITLVQLAGQMAPLPREPEIDFF